MNIDNQAKQQAKQQITAWADAILQSAKQLIVEGEVYLIWGTGLPWYRRGEDAWADEAWWIETAQTRYPRYRSLANRWKINELEILTHHLLLDYREEARSRIDQWYKESARDPQSWAHLVMKVYPEHPLFQDLRDSFETYSQRAILAKLGDEATIAKLRKELLESFEAQDWFWVNEILSSIAAIGGKSLLDSIASSDELQQIRQAIATLAAKSLGDAVPDSDQAISEELGQATCIQPCVRLGWQEAIEALSENQNYLQTLNSYDILWWSLTDKKQLVEQFLVKHIPRIFPGKPLTASELAESEFESERMALAIAWKRVTS